MGLRQYPSSPPYKRTPFASFRDDYGGIGNVHDFTVSARVEGLRLSSGERHSHVQLKVK